ncbi:hemerythrin domain-containing protein [Devosia sp. RR2S18]|uniref:hemerythrin domain-containing protein n=1 Tax=Devosia rhizosphaerae TaxID=3049774 RepID=UPI002542386E|nr:hemerythrin domain-containing protein [Devosia sp. RR2S18]WIJ26971.1 hemerythrin domain-containing protein [Devosia sp. RR2S18]
MRNNSPLVALERHHWALLHICEELEMAADDLPDRLEPARCAKLVRATLTTLADAHAGEERLLFPMLAAAAPLDLAPVARRLRQEHETDQAAAEELKEALLSFAEGRPFLSTDAMGYLLRSFFEGVRRHVRSEQELVTLLLDFAGHKGSMH